MPTGYCAVPDVRRAIQQTTTQFDSGAWGESDNQAVVDAITSYTEWLEKTLKRHFYVSNGISEDTHDLIPTSATTRDDEHDIQTSAWLTTERQTRGRGFIFGSNPNEDTAERGGLTPKTWNGDYTRIELDRRDAQSITELLVRTPDGYEDWVTEKDGGTWPDALGDDWYLRINNEDVPFIYLDVTHLLDDDDKPLLDSFSNAVYVTWTYGHEGLPNTIRRAVAFKAAAQLLLDDETAVGIPDSGNLVNPETKVQAMERQAEELLEVYQ